MFDFSSVMKPAETKDTFLYFAYGSNLLKKRIHINNPSAEYIGIGRLDDHQLNFIKFSPNWNGTSATIVPMTGAHVWGAVWRINNMDMPALDRQEGVDINWYFAKTVDIAIGGDAYVKCRTYQQTINPPPRNDNEDIPPEQRPSLTYLQVILQGAADCQLPKEYIDKLRKIQHNGKEAPPAMLQKLQGL